METNQKSTPFWETAQAKAIASTVSDIADWAESGMLSKALEYKITLKQFSKCGDNIEGEKFDKLITDLLVPGSGRWLLKENSEHSFAVLVSESSYIRIYRNTELAIQYLGLHDADMDAVKAIIAPYIVPIKRVALQGRAYIVTDGMNGPSLMTVGNAGEKFIPENYAPDVVEAYRHVVKDLNSSNPCGSVIVLDGPPGTGKTHCVRALMNEVEAVFILVPSNMVAALGSPQFISVLINARYPNRPIVLIVEDADECLSSRNTASVTQISALLNFSDGILGASLNVRILATTNVSIKELDRAVVRDGRLCRRIAINELDASQAQEVYTRLTGQPFAAGFPTGASLATIYRAARNQGIKETNEEDFPYLAYQVDEEYEEEEEDL